MDVIGRFLLSLHQLLGHDKAAIVIGASPGSIADCIICQWEDCPSEDNKRAVIAALSPDQS